MTVVFNPLLQFEGKQTWSLAKTFGSSIRKTCPVAAHSRLHVDVTDLDDMTKLYPKNSYKEYTLKSVSNNQLPTQRQFAIFDLRSMTEKAPNSSLNVGVKQNQIFKKPQFSSRKVVPVSLRSHTAGLGAYEGTIVVTITNALDETVRVTFMDVIPYFMRVYIHTLHIRQTSSNQELKPDRLNLSLSQEKTPTLIEFSLTLPPISEIQISYDFERAFLRWTDFKPDANKGVLLSSAMIEVSTRYLPVLEQLAIPLCSAREELESSPTTAVRNTTSEKPGANQTPEEMNIVISSDKLVRIYARPLLVILPTPDFSMPYNVLCLVCTVLVFAFGPIYNVAVRRPIVRRKKRRDDDTKEETGDNKKDQ